MQKTKHSKIAPPQAWCRPKTPSAPQHQLPLSQTGMPNWGQMSNTPARNPQYIAGDRSIRYLPSWVPLRSCFLNHQFLICHTRKLLLKSQKVSHRVFTISLKIWCAWVIWDRVSYVSEKVLLFVAQPIQPLFAGKITRKIELILVMNLIPYDVVGSLLTTQYVSYQMTCVFIKSTCIQSILLICECLIFFLNHLDRFLAEKKILCVFSTFSESKNRNFFWQVLRCW
jgi:hypothetical protein